MADLIDAEHIQEDMGGDCPNCGGEGKVYDCIDGFCFDPEGGCELCSSPCEWCGGEA